MLAAKDELFTRPSGGYSIARSVRLRSSASAYLNRTPATATNRKIWTWSSWVKRGTLAINNGLFEAYPAVSNQTSILFTANNTFVLQDYVVSNYNLVWESSAVYRDPSAWYHVVVAFDNTQASSANVVKLYINGIQQTLVFTAYNGSYVANRDAYINSNILHNIGAYAGASNLDGYLTEINFIDGQNLTPSSFGENNTKTGVWQPIKYTGTYGTNGFYLNFSDNSNNTAATIGKDYSGNGNNWTPNNISVTAGATYDSMVDSPTVSGLSSNYPVSNVLDIDRADITTTNGNLTLTKATANNSPRAAATFGATSGKFYAEITWTSITNTTPNDNYVITGVTTKENWTDSSNGYNAVLYVAANNGLAIAGNRAIWTAGSFGGWATYGSNYFVSGSVIGIALNLDAGTVTFYLNNVSQGAITLPTTAQPWFFYNTSDGTGNGYTANWNFGQQPFTYTPPTGFVALNTYNLPASTITNGAAYMAATTYTGNLTGQSITNTASGASFQPDLVWIKSRSASTDNKLTDSVRGATNALISNTAGTETSDLTGVTAFNSNGFTLGASTVYNNTGVTYVGWQWKAGGTSVSNTSGILTSQVSANTTDGFSVCTYTAPASSQANSFGHGLGVAPSMVIAKNRSSGTGGLGWAVYHSSLGANQVLSLNTTAASATVSGYWGSGMTSTVVGLPTAASSTGFDNCTGNMVAYCFAAVAGFSAFGSYVGNGSADGPFVFLGFRPRLIMIKDATNSATQWTILDSSRNTFNITNARLMANLANSENAEDFVDLLSNGFKVRPAFSSTINTSGANLIYMAFAENPFKNALAR